MIKTAWIISVLTVMSLHVQSQHLFLTNPDSLNGFFKTNSVLFSIEGGVYQQSNAITNSFINKIINGGFIDNDLKNDQFLSPDNNYFNAGFSASVGAMIVPDTLFGSLRYGLRFNISHTDDLSARFTEDVFNSVMFGNRMYAGENASFHNTAARFQQFQQLDIGFFDKTTLSYVTVGVVNGNFFADLFLDETQLYTEATGAYIDLEADGDFHISDTSATQSWMLNGLGGVVNFELNFPIRFKNRPDKPSYLRVGAHNMGLIRWNEKTVNYQLDTTYHYNGFLIDDLVDTDFDVEEVVDSLVPNATHESYLLTTPGMLYLGWFSPLGSSLFYEIEVRTKTYAFHLPEFKAHLYYQPGDRWLIGANATFGGFGGYDTKSALRAGLFLSAFLGNHFQLTAQSDHIAGWVNDSAFGRNVFFKLSFFL